MKADRGDKDARQTTFSSFWSTYPHPLYAKSKKKVRKLASEVGEIQIFP